MKPMRSPGFARGARRCRTSSDGPLLMLVGFLLALSLAHRVEGSLNQVFFTATGNNAWSGPCSGCSYETPCFLPSGTVVVYESCELVFASPLVIPTLSINVNGENTISLTSWDNMASYDVTTDGFDISAPGGQITVDHFSIQHDKTFGLYALNVTISNSFISTLTASVPTQIESFYNLEIFNTSIYSHGGDIALSLSPSSSILSNVLLSNTSIDSIGNTFSSSGAYNFTVEGSKISTASVFFSSTGVANFAIVDSTIAYGMNELITVSIGMDSLVMRNVEILKSGPSARSFLDLSGGTVGILDLYNVTSEVPFFLGTASYPLYVTQARIEDSNFKDSIGLLDLRPVNLRADILNTRVNCSSGNCNSLLNLTTISPSPVQVSVDLQVDSRAQPSVADVFLSGRFALNAPLKVNTLGITASAELHLGDALVASPLPDSETVVTVKKSIVCPKPPTAPLLLNVTSALSSIDVTGVLLNVTAPLVVALTSTTRGIMASPAMTVANNVNNVTVLWRIASDPDWVPNYLIIQGMTTPNPALLTSFTVYPYKYTLSYDVPSGYLLAKFGTQTCNPRCDVTHMAATPNCVSLVTCPCTAPWGGPYCDCNAELLPGQATCSKDGGKVLVADGDMSLDASGSIVVPDNYTLLVNGSMQLDGHVELGDGASVQATGLIVQNGTLVLRCKLRERHSPVGCEVYSTTSIRSLSLHFTELTNIEIELDVTELSIDGSCPTPAGFEVSPFFDNATFASLSQTFMSPESRWTINLVTPSTNESTYARDLSDLKFVTKILRSEDPRGSSGTTTHVIASSSASPTSCTGTSQAIGAIYLFTGPCVDATPSSKSKSRWYYYGAPLIAVGAIVFITLLLVFFVKPIRIMVLPYRKVRM